MGQCALLIAWRHRRQSFAPKLELSVLLREAGAPSHQECADNFHLELQRQISSVRGDLLAAMLDAGLGDALALAAVFAA